MNPWNYRIRKADGTSNSIANTNVANSNTVLAIAIPVGKQRNDEKRARIKERAVEGESWTGFGRGLLYRRHEIEAPENQVISWSPV